MDEQTLDLISRIAYGTRAYCHEFLATSKQQFWKQAPPRKSGELGHQARMAVPILLPDSVSVASIAVCLQSKSWPMEC
jgi:hypothetical protein